MIKKFSYDSWNGKIGNGKETMVKMRTGKAMAII